MIRKSTNNEKKTKLFVTDKEMSGYSMKEGKYMSALRNKQKITQISTLRLRNEEFINCQSNQSVSGPTICQANGQSNHRMR